jgi:thiol-disulfide isomerase/thioredoxin
MVLFRAVSRPALLVGLIFGAGLAGSVQLVSARASGKGAAPPVIRFLDAAHLAAEPGAADDRPTVVVVRAGWCPACRWMEHDVFPRPRIQRFGDDFRWVRVDIDRDLTVARAFMVEATPTLFLLDREGRVRERIVGTVAAGELEKLLLAFSARLEQGMQPPSLVDHQGGQRSSLLIQPEGYRALANCSSQVGYGPLDLTSQSPFQSLRLGLRQRLPSTLGNGQFEVKSSNTWSNIWANGLAAGTYFLDYETLTSKLGLSYGLSDTVQMTVEIEDRSRFAGSMDGLIQGFHDLFRIDQDGRDEVPKDQFAFRLSPGGGQPAVELGGRDRGSFSRSMLVSVQHNVTCGGTYLPAISYALTVRYGLGRGQVESRGDLDVGGSVAAARHWRNFYTYLTLGFARYTDDHFRGIRLKDSQYTALGALEWRRWPRTSLIVQYLHSQGAAIDFKPFSSSTNEVSFGWKKEVFNRGVLEIGIIENVITFENSPDFGIHLGYSVRY